MLKNLDNLKDVQRIQRNNSGIIAGLLNGPFPSRERLKINGLKHRSNKVIEVIEVM